MIALYVIFILLLAIMLIVLLWPLRQQKGLCLSISALFFVGLFALYGWVGSPNILPLLDARQKKIEMLKTSMEKNAAIVKADPNNLAAWIALSQDFIETGQWEAAVNALRRAVLLSNGDPKLIMAYAKAMILVDGGKVSANTQKSLKMVLLQDPKNEEARYYLAVKQLQDGSQKEAMKSMKALYRSLPEDSPLKAMIDKQIGK
jgi:cytochrome c-type biogenesis protein CcmH/NrfG